MGNKIESLEHSSKNLKNNLMDLGIIPNISSKLNIFICGKYECESSLLYHDFVKEKDNDYDIDNKISSYGKYKNNYFQKSKFGIHYNKSKKENGNSYWKFYELSSIKSSKECESLKNIIENKIKKNIIQNAIIYYCGEKDNNDFEILNQLNKIEKCSHPFIVFLSKEKTKENYNEYIIKNELQNKKFFYDILNIYHINERNVNDKIFEILWKIYNYYYQISNDINNNNFICDNCLNIYLIGKPGTGKSSFINEVFEERKALENDGKNVTTKINQYSFIGKLNSISDEKGRINIFDTPGFSTSGKELKSLKTIIKNIFFNYISNQDLIHCFLYFLDGRVKEPLMMMKLN